MNDQKIIQYIVRPTKAYAISRNCPGCLGKSIYRSTDKFRVNANGNRLDVWLIYQCESCKHTYNLPIYERKHPDEIPAMEYQQFMDNSSSLSLQYGTTLSLFTGAKAVIDWQSSPYEVLRQGILKENEKLSCSTIHTLILHNPARIKVRMDKILAQVLDCSRSKISQAIKKKEIVMEMSDTACTVTFDSESEEFESSVLLKEIS